MSMMRGGNSSSINSGDTYDEEHIDKHYYHTRLMCLNCFDDEQEILIKKGIKVDFIVKEIVCTACGCKTISKQKMDLHSLLGLFS